MDIAVVPIHHSAIKSADIENKPSAMNFFLHEIKEKNNLHLGFLWKIVEL